MLKENVGRLRKLFMLTDYLLVCLAFVAAVRFQELEFVIDIIVRIIGVRISLPEHQYILHLDHVLLGAMYWVVSLRSYGGYNSFRNMSYLDLCWRVLKSVLIATMAFGTITFILAPEILTQGIIVLLFVNSLFLLLSERIIILYYFHRIRERGYNYRHVLFVGSGELARDFVRVLEATALWGFKVIGFVDEPQKVGRKIDGKKVVGSFDELGKVLDNNVVDEVVFCLPRKWMDRLEELVITCEKVGVKMHISLDFFNTSIARSRLSNLAGNPVLCLESTPPKSLEMSLKRGMDIFFSLLILLFLSPVFLLVGLAVKLSSRGGVIYSQERCGQNGRKFKMHKFRTMVINAEDLRVGLKERNEASGPVFKIKNDPRMTRVGKYLRKFSLDELPQFFNVLKGEMSIVGPRPPLPSEVNEYDRWQRRRLSMRPGITCLWQVSGRNIIAFEDWVRLDLEYIDKWSLLLDMKIILKTVPAIFRGTGA
ncbi:MAG: sugar transferase [bacterium]